MVVDTWQHASVRGSLAYGTTTGKRTLERTTTTLNIENGNETGDFGSCTASKERCVVVFNLKRPYVASPGRIEQGYC